MGTLYGRILCEVKAEGNQPLAYKRGLRAGHSCNDNINSLKQIFEKELATNWEVHFTFLDPQETYDNISLKRLRDVLKTSNIKNSLVQPFHTYTIDQILGLKPNKYLSEHLRLTTEIRDNAAHY